MSDLYKNIVLLCEQNGTNVSQMCKNLSITRSVLSELSAGRTRLLSAETMQKIATHFSVSIEYLNQDVDMLNCPCCGENLSQENANNHAKIHAKWKKAVKKHGFAWGYQLREHIKATARNERDLLDGKDASKEAESIEKIFKALFSRSLQGSLFSEEHIGYEEYCAGLLNGKTVRMSENAYSILSTKYGNNSTQTNGTYFVDEKSTPSEDEVLNAEIIKLFAALPADKKVQALDYLRFLKAQGENP